RQNMKAGYIDPFGPLRRGVGVRLDRQDALALDEDGGSVTRRGARAVDQDRAMIGDDPIVDRGRLGRRRRGCRQKDRPYQRARKLDHGRLPLSLNPGLCEGGPGVKRIVPRCRRARGRRSGGMAPLESASRQKKAVQKAALTPPPGKRSRQPKTAPVGAIIRWPPDEDRVEEIFVRLSGVMPDPKTELDFVNPYTLVVAVALSAQATDVGV